MKKSVLVTFYLLLFPFISFSQDSLVIVDTTSQIRLLDHRDNDSLRSIGEQTYNEVWGWTNSNGQEFAITGTLDSIYFFHLHPSGKLILSDAEAGAFPFAIHRDFKTYRHYCYAVADEGFSTLQIFDLQYLPDSVHKVYDSDSLLIRAHNIFIEGQKLYTAPHLSHSDTAPLGILSLADPENPSILATGDTSTSGYKLPFRHVHDLYVKDHVAFLSTGINGLYITDFMQPDLPVMIDSLKQYPGKGYNHSSWISSNGNYMVMADETHGSPLKLYDITDLNNLRLLDTFSSGKGKNSLPHNPFIKDNLIYVSYYHEGTQIFKITPFGKVKPYLFFDTYPENKDFKGYKGNWGVYPFFPSGRFVASDMKNGLFVFKIDTLIEKEIYYGNKNALNHAVVFPNPFFDKFTLQFTLLQETHLEFILTDAKGRVFAHGNNNFGPGYNEWKIKGLQNLNPATYILTVSLANNTHHHFKIIKDH